MGGALKYIGYGLLTFGVIVGPLVFLKVGGFPGIMALLILGAAPAGIGFALSRAGARAAKVEGESAERNFAELATGLANKHGGQVTLDAVCKASGLPTEEAQAKMRALTGKGLFDLDFDANGQMTYKISAGAGAAQLAQFSGRNQV